MAEQRPKTKQSEFVRWFAPLLEALKDLGGSAAPREALERIAEIEKVPEALRNEILSSGQERFYNQVHWARQYLVWEGLIDSGKRGVWTLTPKGLVTQLDATSAREIFLEQVRKRAAIKKPTTAASESVVDSDGKPEDTPQSDEDASLQSFLRVVKGLSPNGFERLSMRLLREAGFERVSVTGRSNDGGIDGVINEDRLGLDAIYLQAQRWQGTVGESPIRDFKGALDAKGASKGVFITTSSFTPAAVEAARNSRSYKIVLIDGSRLAELMVEHNLGVSLAATYQLKRLDSDYFAEE